MDPKKAFEGLKRLAMGVVGGVLGYFILPPIFDAMSEAFSLSSTVTGVAWVLIIIIYVLMMIIYPIYHIYESARN